MKRALVGIIAGLLLASLAAIAADNFNVLDKLNISFSTATITGQLAVANGGTGVSTSTGTGNTVLSASPTLTGTTQIGTNSSFHGNVSFDVTGNTSLNIDATGDDTTSQITLRNRTGGTPVNTLTLQAARVTAGVPLLVSTGATANQLRTAQTTAPTCTTNCGTSPSVIGTDTAGIITMGGTGVPASGFVLTFNGTWTTQGPACSVTPALATMVVGKLPIAVVTNQTTMTVTTNGTAPANSDKYQYICVGVS